MIVFLLQLPRSHQYDFGLKVIRGVLMMACEQLHAFMHHSHRVFSSRQQRSTTALGKFSKYPLLCVTLFNNHSNHAPELEVFDCYPTVFTSNCLIVEISGFHVANAISN